LEERGSWTTRTFAPDLREPERLVILTVPSQ
jgi:hypothetical protein